MKLQGEEKHPKTLRAGASGLVFEGHAASGWCVHRLGGGGQEVGPSSPPLLLYADPSCSNTVSGGSRLHTPVPHLFQEDGNSGMNVH